MAWRDNLVPGSFRGVRFLVDAHDFTGGRRLARHEMPLRDKPVVQDLGRASHEFIITLKRQHREHHVSAMDVAKRLLDYGMHAPTTYFPLLVPECLLIEPTETESKEELDRFCDALCDILREISETPQTVTAAPHTMPVRRLDDVRAAKQLDLVWKPNA